MNINISINATELGQRAAKVVAGKLSDAIEANGEARLLLSTGASQMETLKALIKTSVQWKKVEVFHLDEYIGLPDTHAASFRKYLKDRFLSFVPVKMFYPVETEGDIDTQILKLTGEIRKKPIDVGVIGIGENAHIAFNDPPADFETKEAFIKVQLDDKCKSQQVNEGWFKSVEEVPGEAISMSVHQILQTKTIVSSVPYKVKADAIHRTFTTGLSNRVPSTILKTHDDYYLFLDRESASKIISFRDSSNSV